jgi:hypothetical protein
MTDASELPPPELETLEPMTEGISAAPVKVGAPPPFYRSDAHGEYYRFLFAGLVMTLGCLMPFSADAQLAGYKTLGGAFYLILALGLVWSMWIAVYGGRFRMKWIMLALIPFLVGLIDFIFVDRDLGIKAWKDGPLAEGWMDALKGAFSRTEEGTMKATNFCRAFGTGRIVVFVGALLNFMFLIGAVFGGAKHAKAQKAALRAAAAERRGR